MEEVEINLNRLGALVLGHQLNWVGVVDDADVVAVDQSCSQQRAV
jgi:hypothetical protein